MATDQNGKSVMVNRPIVEPVANDRPTARGTGCKRKCQLDAVSHVHYRRNAGFHTVCTAIESSHMPRPKGRRLPHRVSVALTEDQFTVVAELANANGVPVSWVVRRAVVEFLAICDSPLQGTRRGCCR